MSKIKADVYFNDSSYSAGYHVLVDDAVYFFTPPPECEALYIGKYGKDATWRPYWGKKITDISKLPAKIQNAIKILTKVTNAGDN